MRKKGIPFFSVTKLCSSTWIRSIICMVLLTVRDLGLVHSVLISANSFLKNWCFNFSPIGRMRKMEIKSVWMLLLKFITLRHNAIYPISLNLFFWIEIQQSWQQKIEKCMMNITCGVHSPNSDFSMPRNQNRQNISMNKKNRNQRQ